MIIFGIAIALAEAVNPARILAIMFCAVFVHWWVTPNRRFVMSMALLPFLALVFSATQRKIMEIPSDGVEFGVVTFAGLAANCIIFGLLFCGIRLCMSLRNASFRRR